MAHTTLHHLFSFNNYVIFIFSYYLSPKLLFLIDVSYSHFTTKLYLILHADLTDLHIVIQMSIVYVTIFNYEINGWYINFGP